MSEYEIRGSASAVSAQRTADAFFSRSRSTEELDALRRELAPSSFELERWQQDSAEARARSARPLTPSAGRPRQNPRTPPAVRARKRKAADAERRRSKARHRYASDPEVHRAYQRERRQVQRDADPEGYRASKRERNKRWRDAHRDEENAKLRAKHRANPEEKRAAAERYYAEHGDEVRQRRREYYWANREKQLEKQRQWRAREKARKDAGLPPRRMHRTSPRERTAAAADAEEFFARQRSSPEVDAMWEQLKPSPEEIARWERDCRRARAGSASAAREGGQRPLVATRQRGQGRSSGVSSDSARLAEEARLDAIARAINDQLRHSPRRHNSNAPSMPLEPARTSDLRGWSR